MAHVSPFTFENMSRIGNDNCYIDQTTIQNTQSCNYLLQNYFAQDCTMKIPKDLATSQPSVFYNGGHGSGAGGCNIDDSSQLLIGSLQTNSKCRTDLFQRPFVTVPFLGRGSVCSVLESQIKQGETSTSKKTVTNIAETNQLRYTTVPLLSTVKENLDNHSNLLPDNETRGGVASRDLSRDKR
jgi:hypothetical protein